MPVAPSMRSRRRSAWPLCQACSVIMPTMVLRSEIIVTVPLVPSRPVDHRRVPTSHVSQRFERKGFRLPMAKPDSSVAHPGSAVSASATGVPSSGPLMPQPTATGTRPVQKRSARQRGAGIPADRSLGNACPRFGNGASAKVVKLSQHPQSCLRELPLLANRSHDLLSSRA